MQTLDAIDTEILARRTKARSLITTPCIGDFVRFPTGEVERFSHDWGDDIQTSPGGSFYLLEDGDASLTCGGLNPATPTDQLEVTDEMLPGAFWFFSHDIPGAGRGVYFDIPCRVFKTTAKYDGFLGRGFN
ncbi:hypothetical protein [Azonexus hydrophilus]|uniref:AraC family transcriptional regulator n=1 Tax=Azonexus hydrophilus TaxID=418702 RepID=A0ABZ2XL67_9RHOO